MGTTGTVHIISLWLSCTPPFNEQKNNFSTRLRLLEVVLVGVGEDILISDVTGLEVILIGIGEDIVFVDLTGSEFLEFTVEASSTRSLSSKI